MVFARGFSVRMIKNLIGIVAVGFLLLGLTACETTSPKGMHVHPKVGLNTLTKLFEQEVTDDDLVGSSHRAADSLIKKAGARLDMQRSIAAASFVNIDDLSESSSFGRIVSQQLASRLSGHGFQIIEMLLRKSVYIQQQAGEFLLSRELKNISKEHNVQAAIVGTYAVGKNSVYVTAKIVDSASSIVIASHDYELVLGPNTRSLLLAE
jgi:TolB-like protein